MEGLHREISCWVDSDNRGRHRHRLQQYDGSVSDRNDIRTGIVNGARLPFTEPSTNSRIVSGSIALIGTDSARVNDMTQPVDQNGNPVAVGHVGFDHVTRAGNTLVLLPLISFAAVDTATLQGSQLVVRHHVTTAADTPIEIQLYVAQ